MVLFYVVLDVDVDVILVLFLCLFCMLYSVCCILVFIYLVLSDCYAGAHACVGMRPSGCARASCRDPDPQWVSSLGLAITRARA